MTLTTSKWHKMKDIITLLSTDESYCLVHKSSIDGDIDFEVIILPKFGKLKSTIIKCVNEKQKDYPEIDIHLASKKKIFKSRNQDEDDNCNGSIFSGSIDGYHFDYTVYGTTVKEYNKLLDFIEKQLNDSSESDTE